MDIEDFESGVKKFLDSGQQVSKRSQKDDKLWGVEMLLVFLLTHISRCDILTISKYDVSH